MFTTTIIDMYSTPDTTVLQIPQYYRYVASKFWLNVKGHKIQLHKTIL